MAAGRFLLVTGVASSELGAVVAPLALGDPVLPAGAPPCVVPLPWPLGSATSMSLRAAGG